MEEHNQEQTLNEMNTILEKIANNSNKIDSLLDQIKQSGQTNQSSQSSQTEIDISKVKELLNEEENNNSTIIRDVNKKIKKLDQSNEKLYKTRKPCNIKIPSSQSSSQLVYLENQKEKYINEIEEFTKQIVKLSNDIENLKNNELKIEENNSKILELHKQQIQLPPELFTLTADFLEIEENYNIALEEFILDIEQLHPAVPKDIPSYKEFQKKAQQYFLALEITKYNSNTPTSSESILEEQEKIEEENKKIKQELKQIKILENQIKSLEVKKLASQNQINLILADIDNLEENSKIDEEISENKEKRIKYEKRIEETEKLQLQIKNKCKIINECENITLIQLKLEIDLKTIKDILYKFEIYHQQI
jgi:hypothetical protein